jgi:hypothetical protein
MLPRHVAVQRDISPALRMSAEERGRTTMTITATADEFSLVRVVDRMFHVVGRNLAVLVGLSTLAQCPILAMNLLRLRYAGHFFNGIQPDPHVNPWGISMRYVAVQAISLLVTTVLAYMLQAAIAQSTISALSGKRASMADCARVALRDALALAAIAILSTSVFAAGLVWFVIPGVIVAAAWSVIVPVRVIEHSSIIGTFRRSASLTRDYRWPIAGLVIAVTVVPFALGIVALMILRALGIPPASYISATVISAISLLTLPPIGVIHAALYSELRTVKEGIGPQQLAAVFD